MAENEVRSFRFYLFNFDINRKVLRKYMHHQLGGASLQSFLMLKKHNIYHDWKPREDCKSCSNCNYRKRISKQPILTNKQWNTLFSRTYTCLHPSGDHACMYQAKAINEYDFDTTLCVYILESFLSPNQSVVQALEELREARNRIAHAELDRMDINMFQSEWTKGTTNSLLICDEIDQQFRTEIQTEINELQSRDLDQASSMKFTAMLKEHVDESFEEKMEVLSTRIEEFISSGVFEYTSKLGAIKETVDELERRTEGSMEQTAEVNTNVEETLKTCKETKSSVDDQHEESSKRLKSVAQNVENIDQKFGTLQASNTSIEKRFDEVTVIRGAVKNVDEKLDKLHDTHVDDSRHLQETSKATMRGIDKLDQNYKLSSSEITIAVKSGMQQVSDETNKLNQCLKETNDQLKQQMKVIQQLEQAVQSTSMTTINVRMRDLEIRMRGMEMSLDSLSNQILSNHDNEPVQDDDSNEGDDGDDDDDDNNDDEEIDDKHYCPYDRCRKLFDSEDSLQQHYNDKHGGGYISEDTVCRADIHYYY